MSASANQQERKRKWDQDATEIVVTNAGAATAAAAAAAADKDSTIINESLGEETSIFYSLRPDVLELIGSFCEQEDCIQLRATCKPMKHAADKTLYERALEKFQNDSPIQVNRFFVHDDFGFIFLAEDDGTFPSKDQFIDMCLEKLDSGSSEIARAREELATKGVSNGKFGLHKQYWYRKLDTTTNLNGMMTIMVTWMKVYNKFMDWHNSYLCCCSHMPKEKVETFDEFDNIRDILFGLYAGSSKSSDCKFTTIEFRDSGRGYDANCTKHFAVLPGRKGQKIIFKFGFSGFFEYWDY